MLPSFLNFLDVFLVMVMGSKGGIGTGAIALLARRPLLCQLLRKWRKLRGAIDDGKWRHPTGLKLEHRSELCGMELLLLLVCPPPPLILDMALECWSKSRVKTGTGMTDLLPRRRRPLRPLLCRLLGKLRKLNGVTVAGLVRGRGRDREPC